MRKFIFILLFTFLICPRVQGAWDTSHPPYSAFWGWEDSTQTLDWFTLGNGLQFNGTTVNLTGILPDLANLTPDTDASIIYWSGSAWSLAKSLNIDLVLANEAPTTAGQITYDATNDALRVYDGAAVDTWSNDANIATVPTIDASGFDGNLSTTDDTIQEVAQKVDDLSLGSGGTADKEVAWVIYDSDTETATGNGKQAFVVPSSMNGYNLVDVTASVADLNGATSGVTTVVIRRVRAGTAADMTSTGVTVDYNAYTASDEVVDTANDDLQTGDSIYVDVDAVTSAAQKGLSVTCVFRNP